MEQVGKPPIQVGEPAMFLVIAKKDLPALVASLDAAGIGNLLKALPPTFRAVDTESGEDPEHPRAVAHCPEQSERAA